METESIASHCEALHLARAGAEDSPINKRSHMAVTVTVLRTLARHLVDPAEILRRLNDELVEQNPRGMNKDALKSPSVPALAEFRKAIEEAEKQQQQKKKP